MPPVMETIQTADLEEDEPSGRGQAGPEQGHGDIASPRASTSSAGTITPLTLPDNTTGPSTPVRRPAPPYHPTRTNTSLSSGIVRGDALSYLEAMSTPDLSSLPSTPPPVPAERQTIRGRTSDSIRNLLHRTHLLPDRGASNPASGLLPLHLRNASASGSSTLLLRPISSRTSIPPSPRTPGQSGNGNNPYRHSLAASTFQTPRNSSISLIIGSPIPSTAVRAAFGVEDMPRAGLNEEQMRFLASSEAVDLIGVRMDAPPPPKQANVPGRGRGRGEGLEETPVRGHGRTRSDGAALAMSRVATIERERGTGDAMGQERDGGMGDAPASAPLLDRDQPGPGPSRENLQDQVIITSAKLDPAQQQHYPDPAEETPAKDGEAHKAGEGCKVLVLTGEGIHADSSSKGTPPS